jgi:hypothetical protein
MAVCPRCGRFVEPTERFCTGCGAPVFQATPIFVPQPAKPAKPPVRKIFIAVAVIVIAVGGAVALALSFHLPLTPGSGGPGNPNPNLPGSTMEFAGWNGKDPHAGNAVAFTMLVPKGWSGQGGVQKYQYPFGGSDFNFTATDPAGTSRVFFSLADFPGYIEPQPSDALMNCVSSDLSAVVPCGENTWWLPAGYIGMKLYFHSYLDAMSYIRAYSSDQIWVLTEHPAMNAILKPLHSDINIESITTNTHLQNRIVDVTASQYSGADALFSYTDHGVQYKLLLQLLVTRETFNLGTSTLSFWNTYYWGYSAPTTNFNATGKVYSLIMPTMRANLSWLNSELQRQAQANQMIAQHLQVIMQLQYSLISSLSESQYQTGMGWINALGGSESAYNPNDTTSVYNVSIFYDYWYDCGNGNLIGTNNANYQTTCTQMTIGTPGQ